MQIIKNWYTTAFINFIIAGLLGLTMRLAFVIELPIDYFHVRHAHSHLALLGWVYLGLFAIINHCFLHYPTAVKKNYKILFWCTQASVIAMLLSYFVLGKGVAAISFTLIHVLLSYVYAYHLWQDIAQDHSNAAKFLRAALIWLLLSTAGFWGICIMMPFGMANSIWYHVAMQFFLHFQLSGWLTFAVIALFLKQIDEKDIQLPQKPMNLFFWLLVIATFLTYALAIAWASSHPLSYTINGIGVVVQLGALGILLRILYKNITPLQTAFSSKVFFIYTLVFLAFLVRILIQSALIVPKAAEMAHTIQNLVIAFIHLNVLGFVSIFLIGVAIQNQILIVNKLFGYGLYTFIGGVFVTEVILFLQGLFFWLELGFLPSYYMILLIASILLPMGSIGMLSSQSLPPTQPDRK